MVLTLREMGRRCKQFRVENGYFQSDVAADTGYSVENISSFETGRNDNARILFWYFDRGMTLEYFYTAGKSRFAAPPYGMECSTIESGVKNGENL